MPKWFFIACAVAAAALAACSNYNVNGISNPATPTPVPSYSPNPAITSASVSFSISGTPIPNQPIAMSTPDPNGLPGTAIATVLTDTTGTAKFTNLVYTQTYCWSTSYTPPGATMQTYSSCVPQQYWGSGVHLGLP